ncbi:monovalent cation/H+ antiporter complex subunit F [Abyssibacter sp.]|uniref:monovalent cation/H+ antiporter complex subunit F n=1 Tax=Abyssibacter sp. TaxID=2320200 RepID=UPI0025BE8232|nr:monovalent cation/H+ antiporter complex subunit F [Abyssibacter sp.]MCK5859336.1 pH regulation protein F [Abyssibacter sp.]
MMFAAAMVAVAITMSLALARALLGPSVYDRILALNVFGTKTVLFIAVAGFLFGRPEFLDIGLVYALINFIGTVAVLKLMHYGELGWIDGAGEHDDL